MVTQIQTHLHAQCIHPLLTNPLYVNATNVHCPMPNAIFYRCPDIPTVKKVIFVNVAKKKE